LFEGYKIDHIAFDMQRTIQMIAASIDSRKWEMTINIAKPIFSKSQKKYVCGLQVGLSLMAEKKPESEETGIKEPLVKCLVSIAGLFSIEEGELEKEIEISLLKSQLPAILLPYVRSTMTSILANAGFGSIIFPLINMHEVAKGIKELDIQYID
jgi:preprotein translocase subunit SecB